MHTPVLVVADVPLVGDPRLKSWAKVVDSVDDSRSSGYAFGGYFVATGGVQDLPAGGTLIVYGEKGSCANPRAEVRVYMVNADGTLSHVQSPQGAAWARTIRDRVVDLVSEPPEALVSGASDAAVSDLARCTTQALLEELRRRGWRAGS
jgi:hypothetical protein